MRATWGSSRRRARPSRWRSSRPARSSRSKPSRSSGSENPPMRADDLTDRLRSLGLDQVLDAVEAIGAAGVSLVGGAVRDLLLGDRAFDVDVAVEGDGIAFARE